MYSIVTNVTLERNNMAKNTELVMVYIKNAQHDLDLLINGLMDEGDLFSEEYKVLAATYADLKRAEMNLL